MSLNDKLFPEKSLTKALRSAIMQPRVNPFCHRVSVTAILPEAAKWFPRVSGGGSIRAQAHAVVD